MRNKLKSVATVLGIAAAIGLYCYFGSRAEKSWHEGVREDLLNDNWEIVKAECVYSFQEQLTRPWSFFGGSVNWVVALHKFSRRKLDEKMYCFDLAYVKRGEDMVMKAYLYDSSKERVFREDDIEALMQAYSRGEARWEVPYDFEENAIDHLISSTNFYHGMDYRGEKFDITPAILSGMYDPIDTIRLNGNDYWVESLRNNEPQEVSDSDVRKIGGDLLSSLKARNPDCRLSSSEMGKQNISYKETTLTMHTFTDVYLARARAKCGSIDKTLAVEFTFGKDGNVQFFMEIE